ISTLLLATACLAQTPSANIPRDDTVRVREFYRLSSQIQDQLWPHWSETPAPLLLVTADSEFLTHRPSPPKDFTKITDDFYARPRQFPVNLLATSFRTSVGDCCWGAGEYDQQDQHSLAHHAN